MGVKPGRSAERKNKLRVFKERALMRIYGPKWDEVA
jgi:hypothetical protein